MPVESIVLDQSDVTINRKNTLQLTSSITPQNATNKMTTWATSDKDVAQVDSTGKVTGVGAGTTTITATADQKTATCEVTVVVLMDGITLNHAELAIDKGSTQQLTAKITPVIQRRARQLPGLPAIRPLQPLIVPERLPV